MLRYRIHLQPEPEGGYTVTVPSLPGCVTWGSDYRHSIEMATECIEGFLETLRIQGRAIPKEDASPPIDAVVEVRAPAA